MLCMYVCVLLSAYVHVSDGPVGGQQVDGHDREYDDQDGVVVVGEYRTVRRHVRVRVVQGRDASHIHTDS